MITKKTYPDRTVWYLDGKRHREDGPAIECANGSKYWYQHGMPHRDDGPAVEHASGDKSWWQHGKAHRDDGPAIEDANGYKVWYINGKRIFDNLCVFTLYNKIYLDVFEKVFNNTNKDAYLFIRNKLQFSDNILPLVNTPPQRQVL